MKHKVYLAGAISGLTYDGAEDWRGAAKRMLSELGITGYSPLRQKQFLKSEGALEGSYTTHSPLSSSKGIMTRDFNDVRTSDAVLMNLSGASRVSIGTVMEAAWAWQLKVPLVVVCEPNNIHIVHPMFEQATGYHVETLEEGVHLIGSILLP
jgi:nucleoside 2-deoxyribosyltransferase